MQKVLGSFPIVSSKKDQIVVSDVKDLYLTPWEATDSSVDITGCDRPIFQLSIRNLHPFTY